MLDGRFAHKSYAWKDVEIGQDNKGYYVKAPEASACETHLTGNVNISETNAAAHSEWMCNGGSMSWDITVNKKVAFNVGYGASNLFCKLKAFEMYWHAEGMKSLYSGIITANGEKYIITNERSFGYSDKNWGADFTSPWVWLSSCDLVSKKTGKRLEDSVFDIGGGRPKVFGVALNRKLLSDFWYVRQETTKAIMETSVECNKSEMLLVNYESPDGAKRHNRLWNGGTGTGTVKLWKKGCFGKPELLDEIEAKHIGCEWGEYCQLLSVEKP